MIKLDLNAVKVIGRRAVTFGELLKLASSRKPPDVRVDSRLVKNGDIFVAIAGSSCDGHSFIDQAIARGAKYIVCQRPDTKDRMRDTDCELITVDNSAQAAGLLAQASRGNPASKLTNLAVTGTNGKTTVTFLVRSCIEAAGKKCGLIGTIVYDTGISSCPAPLTTPDCLGLADAQREMVEAGAEYMVIEASSHALYQDRLAGIDFKAAAFTNLTGDHLDFHKTKEAYLAAKMKLFSGLSPDSVAVLNKQSVEAQIVASRTKARILWYAVDEPADITAHIESMGIDGTVFWLDCGSSNLRLKTQNSKLRIRTSLLGRYNVSNHLAAAGLCLAASLDLETIAHGLAALAGVPGRLERVRSTIHGSRLSRTPSREVTSRVLIDYAHTDDALQNVLSTLKPLCKGRLIVVFGCGGDRDRTKRPRMARVAEQFADIVIVTSDNPRTEHPMDIVEQIVAGFEDGSSIRRQKTEDRRQESEDMARRNTQYAIRNAKLIEPDRRRAIGLAIEMARKNDIVLIAGKGHETYQIIGTQKFHFSDREVAKEFLSKKTMSAAISKE